MTCHIIKESLVKSRLGSDLILIFLLCKGQLFLYKNSWGGGRIISSDGRNLSAVDFVHQIPISSAVYLYICIYTSLCFFFCSHVHRFINF